MKKILSIKSLILLALTATAFVSCKEDKAAVGTNPLMLSETKVDLALYGSTPISVTNKGIDPAKIIYHSTDENIATVKDGKIVTMNIGSTHISASIDGDYLATASTTPCLVTVGGNSVIAYTKVYPTTVATNVKDTLEYLFKVNKTNVQKPVSVVTSDSISKSASFVFINAKLNSANPDTCLVIINKADTFNFKLVAEQTNGETFDTPVINVSSTDVAPASMELGTVNVGSVGYTAIGASINVEQGLAETLVVMFNEVTNYQTLKATSSSPSNVSIATTIIDYATEYTAGKVTKTEQRPAIKIMSNTITTSPVTVVVVNNSGLSQTFEVNVVERTTDAVYPTTMTIQSTLALENAETTIPTPKFDDDANVTYYKPTLSYTAIDADTKMLDANDLEITSDPLTGELLITKNEEYFINQGSAKLIITAYKDANCTTPVTVQNAAGATVNLTAECVVTIAAGVWNDPEVTFKQVFDHDNNLYTVSTSLSSPQPLTIAQFTTVKATLYKNTYKLNDKGEVELDDNNNPVIAKTTQIATPITLTAWQNVISGSFTAFAEGVDANLSQYFIDYEFVANVAANGGGNYSVTFTKDNSAGFTLNDGTPFSL